MLEKWGSGALIYFFQGLGFEVQFGLVGELKVVLLKIVGSRVYGLNLNFSCRVCSCQFGIALGSEER